MTPVVRGLIALAVLTLFVPARVAGAQSRPRDSWFGADKIKHFFVSAFVQSVTYSSLRAAGAGHGVSLGAASAATAAVGIGREIHDRRTKGRFSVADLVWDAAGGGAATLVLRKTVR